MTVKVCLAGATGWAGSALARSIAKTTDVTLLAIRKVATLVGVHRGLDSVLDL
jgi:short subunit dehydrogenase-like uncharacterized protein